MLFREIGFPKKVETFCNNMSMMKHRFTKVKGWVYWSQIPHFLEHFQFCQSIFFCRAHANAVFLFLDVFLGSSLKRQTSDNDNEWQWEVQKVIFLPVIQCWYEYFKIKKVRFSLYRKLFQTKKLMYSRSANLFNCCHSMYHSHIFV